MHKHILKLYAALQLLSIVFSY